MSRNMSIFPFQWQALRRTFRGAILLTVVYFAAVVTTLFQLPLWLWLTVEGVMRYTPLWLSIPLFIFLGWQLDTVLNIPLGVGLLFLCGLQLVLYFLRAPRTPLLQSMLRITGFLVFAILTSQWWWGLNWTWVLVQTLLYSVALILNLYRRQRA